MANICRSPTAHGVFQKLVSQNGLDELISVDSAGTHAGQIGKGPDRRAISVAEKRGYDLSKLRARQVTPSDFQDFDYVLAMDDENNANLIEQCEEEQRDKVNYFLAFATKAKVLEVPDPYYGGIKGFEFVLDLVEDASSGLLDHIKITHLPNKD